MNNRRRSWFKSAQPSGPDPDSFIMTFTLLANDSITLPLISTGTYNFTVEWGDGTSDVITAWNQAQRTHSYTGQPAGDYVVTITGTCTAWSFNTVTTSRTKLKSVDQWGDTGFNNLLTGFMGCTNLVSVPSGLKYSGTTLQDFLRSTKITTVPSNFLANCTSVTNVTNMFALTSTFNSIPSGLFDPCTGITSFAGTFQSTGITSIPTDLFRYNTAATNFNITFLSCTGLTGSPPTDIFRYNTSVTNFSGVFNNTRFSSLPIDIFRYNTSVTDFSNALRSMTNLSSLPTDLFRYNTVATTFAGCFFGDTALTSLPADLFRYNTAATSFSETFRQATNLSSVPLDLFDYNVNATTYLLCFFNAIALAVSISSLVDGMDMTKVTTTNQMFSGCTNLTGNGQDLIDKPKAAGYTVGTGSGTGSYRTFFNCTGLTDFATIPAAWK